MDEIQKLIEDWKENPDKEVLEEIIDLLFDIKDNSYRESVLIEIKNSHEDEMFNILKEEINDKWVKLTIDNSFGKYVLENRMGDED